MPSALARLPAPLRLNRDQAIVAAALVAMTVLAWAWLVRMGQDMSAMNMPGMNMAGMDMSKMDMSNMDMSKMNMPGMEAAPLFNITALALASLMWIVMMLGMMLPSAMPMILLFTLVQRRRLPASPLPQTTAFLAGYAFVWGGFSVLAACLQLVLAQSATISADLVLTSRWLSGAVLVAAGLYELSPLKHRCLRYCRGPLDFVARHWRPGIGGALRMGLLHGALCLGCCWVLMLLLFVGGVMNLLWVAALGALVLVQKILPGGRALTLGAAALLFAGGAVVFAGAV